MPWRKDAKSARHMISSAPYGTRSISKKIPWSKNPWVLAYFVPRSDGPETCLESVTMGHQMTATGATTSQSLSWGYFDKEKAGDWSMTGTAIKTCSAAALLFVIVGIVPLITSVHGQQETEIDREVARIDRKIDQLEIGASQSTAQLTMILEHDRLRDKQEDERETHHQEFETWALRALLSALGAFGTMVLGYFIHWWTGFTPVRPLDRKRER